MADVVNLNQSRVKMFRRCQKQYSFRYDYPEMYGGGAGQEMVPQKKKLPLYRGSWMHALQESLHYQWAGYKKFKIEFGEGKHALKIKAKSWKDVHAVLADQFNTMFEEEREDLGDLPAECERMFKAYLRYWKSDRERYTVAQYDDKPMIEFMVDCPLTKVGGRYYNFKGKLDLVVNDDEYGGLWIWDAKWVKNIPHPDERMMSPQAIMYVWALREHYGLDVRGFLYNYGRTKPPTVPAVLQRGTLTLRANLDTDYSTYLQAIKDLHGDNWKKYIPYYREKLNSLKGREQLWFRRERIPVEPGRIAAALAEYVATAKDVHVREPSTPPRSYFYNCKFGCDYHDLCVSEFNGLDITPLVKANYQFTGERYGEEDLLKD